MVAAAPPPGFVVYDQISLDGQRSFVFRERADGTRRVLIMRGAYDPVWSPDGRFVAAFQGRGIAIATPNGRVVRRMPSVGSTAFLSWSPDGRWLAYVAQHCPSLHEDPACGTLWVIRADGTGQRRASRESALDIVHSFERTYSWSPDSRRIVYANLDGLVISDIVSGRRHLLGPSVRIKANADWSPDGRRLLYTYGVALVTSAPDGSRRRVVYGAFNSFAAAWSPDGTRIAYIRPVNGDDLRLFVSRPDGSQRVQLGQALDDKPLRWSPDGRFVLLGALENFELFSVDGRAKPRFIRGGEDGDWR